MGKKDIVTKNLKAANQSLTHMGNLAMGKLPSPTKDIVTRNMKAANQGLIHMENLAAIGLAQRNKMKLASTFYNERSGHEVGLFTSQG